MKKYLIFGSLLLILGVLLFLVPLCILPVCDKAVELASGGMAPMACHYTGIFAAAAGLLIALAGLLTIIFQNGSVSAVLGIQAIAVSLATVVISTRIIGVCNNIRMRCHMGTRPAVLLICVLTTVTGGLQIISGIKIKRKEA